MKKALSLILTAVMLLGVLSVFTIVPVSAATWTAEAPKGSGTQEDPYLIATPGNFIWIQKNMNNSVGKNVDTDGDGEKDFATYDFGKTSFVGVYFEQVCDIDFEGAAIKSIGDYLCDTNIHDDGSKELAKIYGGFGGNYNGNGFALKNATVTASNQNKTNQNWCCGLFGAIYGATLKNMVLDNIDVTANNPSSGILVGRAYAPTMLLDTETNTKATHPDAGEFDFNVIENIVITETSSITAKTALEKCGNMTTAVKVGSIAGVTVGTTIKNCTNNAPLNVSCGVLATGGIVGATGNSTIIDSCVNNGKITLAARPSTMTNNAGETPMGGIVGHILATAAYGAESYLVAAKTGVKITNCVNNGGAAVTATSSTGLSTHMWGGILGAINSLTECTDAPGDHSYLIENCYNTSTGPSSATRIGGIVGSGWNSGSAGSQKTVDTLYIKDSFSVDVKQGAYVGTNEFNCQKNDTADGLQSIIVLGMNATLQAGTYQNADKSKTYTAADGDAYTLKTYADKTYATRALTDYIYVAKADGTGYELSTTTKFQDLVDAIESDIALAQAYGKTVVALGYQEGLDDGVNNNAGAYRLIFGLHKTEYRNVGVSVAKTVEGGATTFANVASDVVYKSVYAYVDGEETKVDADDLGVDYLTTLTINDIPASGTVTYTITTYVTNRDTAKTLTKGDIIVVKFTDGALVSAEIK